MSEVVVRFNSKVNYFECVEKDDLGNLTFRKIEFVEYLDMLKEFSENENKKYNSNKGLNLLEKEIIAINERYVVVKQEGRKRIVTYNDQGKVKTYKISFPNSIYIIQTNISKTKIEEIECFAYKDYQGEQTELFEYPMPNELFGNNMCIGNADRSIKDGNVINTLERIIFTPYSHSTFSGMNGFSQTKVYFEYLQDNVFPYKMMKPLKKKLKDVLK